MKLNIGWSYWECTKIVKRKSFSEPMLIEKLLNASLLWNHKGDQRQNDVYREHNVKSEHAILLIVTCQTLRFCWVVSGSLMFLQNVCLVPRWTKLVWKPQETRLSWKFSGTSVFCLWKCHSHSLSHSLLVLPDLTLSKEASWTFTNVNYRS